MTSSARHWPIFFAYTAWSIVTLVLIAPFFIAFPLDLGETAAVTGHPWVSALIVLQIALGAWSVWVTTYRWSRRPGPAARGRWDLPSVGTLRGDWTLALAAAPCLVIALLTATAGIDVRLLLASVGTLLCAVLVRTVWWWGLVGWVSLFLLGRLLGLGVEGTWQAGVFLFVAVLTVRSSLWLAALVRELDGARSAQSQLAVAEERLRFARDLHDVTGRDLSVIAVKSELVAQLAEREDPRALEHSQEVAQIARSSLAEIRALVRGYREADLAAELRGTVSLLRSAHVRVDVDGDAEDVPDQHARIATWVLREGGTNVLRHADPRHVRISLGPTGIELANDGAPADAEVVEGAGLTGMRERLDPGASLRTRSDDGTFTLTVRYDDPDPGGPP